MIEGKKCFDKTVVMKHPLFSISTIFNMNLKNVPRFHTVVSFLTNHEFLF